MADKIPDSHFGNLVERYQAGESLLSAERRLGISRRTLHKFLVARDVPIRGTSAAEALKWQTMTAEQRSAQVVKAHAAARGRKCSDAELCRKASIRSRNPVGSAYERAMIRLLSDRGIDSIPQLAIGPYNCDIAAYPVAVEIFGGNWHWSGRHILRTPKRVRHFLNGGWHVLMVWVGRNGYNAVPSMPEVADYVAAYIQHARSNPTTIREYRVVRGAGELWASGDANDDDLTIENALRRREGPARKRHRR